jgi:hypothetical protein
MNEITNFSNLLSMFILGEIHSLTFSISIAYTKRWILSTPIGYQPINHVLGFHLFDHVVINIIKSLVPNIKTLGVVLFAWNLTTLVENALWLLQYDGGSMVIRSWCMPHSSTPSTTTSFLVSNQHYPLVWKIFIPF